MTPVRQFLVAFALLCQIISAQAVAATQDSSPEFSLEQLPGGKAGVIAVGFFVALAALSAVFLRRRKQDLPMSAHYLLPPQTWTPPTAAVPAVAAPESALADRAPAAPSAPSASTLPTMAADPMPAPEAVAENAGAAAPAPESPGLSQIDAIAPTQPEIEADSTPAVPVPAPEPAEASTAVPNNNTKPLIGLLPYRETAVTRDPTLIMEVAEMMTLFGWPKSAAKTLVAYIDTSPHQSLQPSLKLLEVYRSAGMKTEYDILAGRIKQSFNVAIPGWQETDEPLHHTLEHFPHILARISASWGRPECLIYLRRLLQDTRSGCRAGFPMGVLNELLLLESILETRQELPLAA